MRKNREQAEEPIDRDLDRAAFDSRWGSIFSLPRFSMLRGLEAPRIKKREDARNIYVEVKTPEIDKKDIKVALEDGLLSISARKSYNRQEKRRGYFSSVSGTRSFSDQLYLGNNVGSRMKTEFKAGRLRVTVPKRAGEKQVKVTGSPRHHVTGGNRNELF